jgi:hypothetical protein
MNYCGLRLALTLPNDPMMQSIEEPSMVKKLKLKNLRVKLRYISSDEPYYISEEPVNQRLWQKVQGLPLNEAWSQVVVDKSDSEWNEFLERCRKNKSRSCGICYGRRGESSDSDGHYANARDKKKETTSLGERCTQYSTSSQKSIEGSEVGRFDRSGN